MLDTLHVNFDGTHAAVAVGKKANGYRGLFLRAGIIAPASLFGKLLRPHTMAL